MPEDYFGEDVAARYDEGLGSYGDPAAIQRAVDFLAELAGDGPALEFAIGTGRIALPLAARGVPVHGIDLSGAMVERLRAKPGGEAIPVALGDYATTCVDGTFTLVYLLFNTINNQTTQEGQLATFANAAAHLATDGCFVVEVGVPGLAPLEIFDLGDTHVGIDERHPGTPRGLAGGARPDGAPRWHGAPRALERLEPRALHRREHAARLGLAEELAATARPPSPARGGSLARRRRGRRRAPSRPRCGARP